MPERIRVFVVLHERPNGHATVYGVTTSEDQRREWLGEISAKYPSDPLVNLRSFSYACLLDIDDEIILSWVADRMRSYGNQH